ncbi:stimulated by retinoic acid gene 6 protein isoform X2 [Biomphalaria glabrata]|nr:stimulated by retinoic acid gene 6 protein isoform X2 [Biomphalaria glabrata]
MMALSIQRTRLWSSCLKGRPGLVYPMDTMTRLSRLSYCAAFGATAFLVYDITLEGKLIINYEGPVSLKTLNLILSMLIYGMVLFPLFACLALRTAFGYSLGFLYIFVFLIIEVMSLVHCIDRLQEILRFLPSVLCRAFLCFSLPVKFYWAFKKRHFFTNVTTENSLGLTLDQVRDSYQGRHVRNLLRKTERKAKSGILNKLKHCCIGTFWSIFYQRQKGFRFPARFVSVMFVGGCVVYILAVEFLFLAFTFTKSSHEGLEYIEHELNTNWKEDANWKEAFDTLKLILDVLHHIIDLVYCKCFYNALTFVVI